MFVLPCIYTNDTNPMAICDVNCLFSVVVYLGIQVASFDSIFDCITNMIGLLFYLQIVKSTPCNQTCQKTRFCDLYSDVYVTCYVFICFDRVA